jgi:hypothetical protein
MWSVIQYMQSLDSGFPEVSPQGHWQLLLTFALGYGSLSPLKTVQEEMTF